MDQTWEQVQASEALIGTEKCFGMMHLVPRFPGPENVSIDICAGVMAVTKACPLFSEPQSYVGGEKNNDSINGAV